MNDLLLLIANDIADENGLNQETAYDIKARLLRSLRDRSVRIVRDHDGTTHAEDCWRWDKKHCESATGRIEQIEARIARVTAMADEFMDSRNMDRYTDGVADGFNQAAKILEGKAE